MARKIGRWGKPARHRRHSIGNIGKSNVYLSYEFSPEEVLSLIKTNKKFREAVLEGKFYYFFNHLMLTTPETLAFRTSSRFSSQMLLSRQSAFYLAKKVVYEPMDIKIPSASRMAVKAFVRSQLEMPVREKVLELEGPSDGVRIFCYRDDTRHKNGKSKTYSNAAAKVSVSTSGSAPYVEVVTRNPSKRKSKDNIFELQFPSNFNSLSEDHIAQWASLFATSDTRFNEQIVKYMEQRNVTVEALAERARVSTKTISRMRNEEGYRCSLRSIVAVCLALHLYPLESFDLITNMGYSLNSSYEEKVYRGLIQTCYPFEMEDINILLISWDIAPFEYKERKSTK